MCHLLPVIALTHANVSCYGKITTKDVCGSMQTAFFFYDSRKMSKITALSLLV